MIRLAPRAQEESVRPRRPADTSARPLSFTVRRHMTHSATVGLLVIALTSACLASDTRVLSAEEVAAVTAAESFIARHGYTSAGHPADQPVQDVELLDFGMSDADLVRRRRDTLEPRAFGIATEGPHAYSVLFHRTHHASGFRVVFVKDSIAVEVVHSTPMHLDWVAVPSNNRWRGP